MKKVIALACMLVFTCAAAIALMAWPAQAQLQNDLAAEMFALTNAHRVSVGLPALLHGGASAQAAANTRAAEIHLLTRQQIDDHERPNGDSFVFLLMDYGLPSTNSNENLLPSQISSSASAALGRFLDSTAHRNTIQRALYTHMAVGVYEHNGRFYWVQFFLTFTPGSFPETTAPGGVTTTTTTTTTTTATTAATTTAATTAATTTAATTAATTTAGTTAATTTAATTAATTTAATTAATTTAATTTAATTAATTTAATTAATTTAATTAATTTTAPPSAPGGGVLSSIAAFFLSLLSIALSAISSLSLLR